jgi:antitoxin component YwqK of YwqJK toxin-antitoxin module
MNNLNKNSTKEFYPNDVLRCERKGNIKKGYWPSGNLEYIFEYSDNTQTIHKYKKITTYFDNSKQIKEYECNLIDGKKNGYEYWYFPNGNPKWEIPFIEGQKDGIEYEYDTDGIKYECKWANGNRITKMTLSK